MRRTIAALALTLAAAAPAPAQDLQFFTMGAGPVGGGYYAAARAICEAIHGAHAGRTRCSPDPSPGSVYNAAALRDGALDFALVQSDIQRQAVLGTGPFAALGPSTDLRSVLALYHEPLTIVAAQGSGISAVEDLAGKRLSIGPLNSGSRSTVDRLIDGLSIDRESFAELRALPATAALDELCQGRIDAVLMIIGHPNAGVGRALSDCGATLVPLAGRAIAGFVADNPDYSLTAIPAATYPSLRRDVPTFSVTATLLTRADVPADLVAEVAGTIVAALPAVNRRAPVVPKAWDPAMATAGQSAPAHEGAAAVAAAN